MTEQDEDPTMLGAQRPKAYEGLFEVLVRRLGLNLTRRRRAGDLDHKAIERMMNHCAAYAETEQCKAELRTKGRKLSEPPRFCGNRKALMFLKSRDAGHSDSSSDDS